MVLSCSSFGLPSESFEDKISDKEIMSDKGKNSPSRNLQLKSPPKAQENKEALDVSFDFLEDKGKASDKSA